MRRSVAKRGRVRYKKPWARWFVNLVVAALVGAALLAAMAYVPPYWRSWKAESAIKDVASQTYSRRSQKDSWFEVLENIRSKIRRKMTTILGASEASESLEVHVSKNADSSWIRIRVTWDDIAKFPLVHERRLLHFSIQVKAAAR